MRDGIPLRQVVLAVALAAVALAVGLGLRFRSLAAATVSPEPLRIVEVPPDPAAEEALARAIEAARASRGSATLDEEAANRALFAEWGPDARRAARLVLDPPYARLRLSQEEGDGRWLNADLVVAPYAGERGLALRVLSGRVGAVAISHTSGEWVRERIERQIEADLARNPRTAALFAGLRDARVTDGGLELRFGP